MIKLQIIGHLGKDCVVNTVGGKSVINFRVAHTDKFKDNQGVNQERTIWVDCAYWTDRTAVAPYLTKGTQVFVEGSPEVKTYNKQDGTVGFSLSLRVRDVQLLGSPRRDGGPAPVSEAGTSESQVNSPADITEPVDDLPF